MSLANPTRTLTRSLTLNFSKTFYLVCNHSFVLSLISTGRPPCLVQKTQSFLLDRCSCVTQVASSESVEMFCNDPFLALFYRLFSSTIFCKSTFFHSCFLCDVNLAISSSYLSVSAAVEDAQEALDSTVVQV